MALVAGAPAATRAEIDMTMLRFGRTIRGIVQSDAVSSLFIPELIGHHQAGRFSFDRLVRFHDFDDINRTVDDMRAGTTITPILRIG